MKKKGALARAILIGAIPVFTIILILIFGSQSEEDAQTSNQDSIYPAMVNGKPITIDRYCRSLIDSAPLLDGRDIKTAKADVLNNLILAELVHQDALKRHPEITSKEAFALLVEELSPLAEPDREELAEKVSLNGNAKYFRDSRMVEKLLLRNENLYSLIIKRGEKLKKGSDISINRSLVSSDNFIKNYCPNSIAEPLARAE